MFRQPENADRRSRQESGDHDAATSEESISQPAAGATELRCPDCTVAVAAGNLRHDATCPIGLAMEAVSATDAQWFADHPGAPWLWRDVQPAEAAHLRAAGHLPPAGEVTGRVQVAQLAPGVRVRRFAEVYAVIGPEAIRQ